MLDLDAPVDRVFAHTTEPCAGRKCSPYRGPAELGEHPHQAVKRGPFLSPRISLPPLDNQ